MENTYSVKHEEERKTSATPTFEMKVKREVYGGPTRSCQNLLGLALSEEQL